MLHPVESTAVHCCNQGLLAQLPREACDRSPATNDMRVLKMFLEVKMRSSVGKLKTLWNRAHHRHRSCCRPHSQQLASAQPPDPVSVDRLRSHVVFQGLSLLFARERPESQRARHSRLSTHGHRWVSLNTRRRLSPTRLAPSFPASKLLRLRRTLRTGRNQTQSSTMLKKSGGRPHLSAVTMSNRLWLKAFRTLSVKVDPVLFT